MVLATICNNKWNLLNMQHITPNLKRWDYSDILNGGHEKNKGTAHILKLATTLEKKPTHFPIIRII